MVDAARGALRRLVRAWWALAPEQRLAAIAALLLFVTMLLPWYSLAGGGRLGCATTHTVSAFGVFSFVEAAVLLVSGGVLTLLFARAEERSFHLPGGDGTVIMAAGAWAAVLLFYRVLDRPPGNGCPVGIEWGFFLAFASSGFLAYAGGRGRAAHRPEPPLPAPREPVPEPGTEPTVRRRRPEDDAPVPGQLSFDEPDPFRRRS